MNRTETKIPTISVILPCHNGENHIHIMLDSMAKQTYKGFKCLVICDACTDNTAEIARQYDFTEVYEVDFHNAGLARSFGLDHVDSDWIMFADDDDYWLHEFVFEQIIEKLIGAEFDVLCFSFIFKHIRYASPLSNDGNLYPAVWNKVWRRSFVGDTRFPNVYPNDDAYFHWYCMQKKPKLAIWDMPLYYYNYLREGSISETENLIYRSELK